MNQSRCENIVSYYTKLSLSRRSSSYLPDFIKLYFPSHSIFFFLFSFCPLTSSRSILKVPFYIHTTSYVPMCTTNENVSSISSAMYKIKLVYSLRSHTHIVIQALNRIALYSSRTLCIQEADKRTVRMSQEGRKKTPMNARYLPYGIASHSFVGLNKIK